MREGERGHIAVNGHLAKPRTDQILPLHAGLRLGRNSSTGLSKPLLPVRADLNQAPLPTKTILKC
jgi:hypothetical protein